MPYYTMETTVTLRRRDTFEAASLSEAKRIREALASDESFLVARLSEMRDEDVGVAILDITEPMPDGLATERDVTIDHDDIDVERH